MNKTWVVYKHTNKLNGKVYIGMTNQVPQYRWGSNGQNYKTPHFKNAIARYGWDNFKHEILFENLDFKKAEMIEKYLIYLYNSCSREYGYNKDGGGSSKKSVSKETRIKQSASARLRPIVSSETKGRLSKVSLGLKRTNETKEKMSLAAKKREKEKVFKFKVPVRCINTGEIFESLREAANWCGLAGTSGIALVCKGRKQITAGVHPVTKEKLKWEYAYFDKKKEKT